MIISKMHLGVVVMQATYSRHGHPFNISQEKVFFLSIISINFFKLKNCLKVFEGLQEWKNWDFPLNNHMPQHV